MRALVNNLDTRNSLNTSLQALLVKTLALVTKSILAATMTLLLFITMYQLIKTDGFPTTLAVPKAIPSITMPEDTITIFDDEDLPIQTAIIEPPERIAMVTDLDPGTSKSIIPSTFKWQESKMTLIKPSRNEAMPIFRVDAAYPERQLARGIEGFVDLSFDVDEIGATKNIQVIAAEPPRSFDKAAMKAVSRWKYEPRVINGKSVYQSNLTTRIRFAIAK